MKASIFLFSLLCFFLAGECSVQAQSTTYFDSRSGVITCAWPTVGLRDAPGKKGKYLSRVHFGENVEQLGEEAYIAEEKRTYVKVQSTDGKVGWVHEYLFVPDGEAAVVLEGARLYKRPNTPSTITTQYFDAGELVILQSEVGGWVSLVGKQKSKEGWMRDPRKVSNATPDIELATLMVKIQEEKDPAKRQKQMEELAQQANRERSPLSPVIAAAMRPDRPQPEAQVATTTASTPPSTAMVSRTSGVAPPRKTQRPDHLDGTLRSFNQETGSIYQMEPLQRMRTDFYAAHATLPMGTRIRVAIPDNQGFVELEIVARPPTRNRSMLGLPPACIEALFGQNVPRQVEILYP